MGLYNDPTEVDKTKIKNIIQDWTLSPSQPVTCNKGSGILRGREVDGKKTTCTGNLLVEIKNQGRSSFEVLPKAQVTNAAPNTFNAPWHHPNVRGFRSSMLNFLRSQLQTIVPGLNGSYIQVLQIIANAGFPSFVMGGAVRDAITGSKHLKDIDCGFGCSGEELKPIATQEGWVFDIVGYARVVIGTQHHLCMEGKALNALNNDFKPTENNIPPTIGLDLYDENMYGDFCCNRLWYDPLTDIVWDPTGRGVRDSLEKVLAIPVPRADWDKWWRGNPTKLLRFWKMIGDGFKPESQAMANFISTTFQAQANTYKQNFQTMINKISDPVKKKKIRDAMLADLPKSLVDNFHF